MAKPYRSLKMKIQDKNEKFTLLSLIAVATNEGYEVAFACAIEIININKEEEAKQKLYQEKLKELQELFKKESLEKLKDINLLEDYGQEIAASDTIPEEGDGEGSEGDTEPQEPID